PVLLARAPDTCRAEKMTVPAVSTAARIGSYERGGCRETYKRLGLAMIASTVIIPLVAKFKHQRPLQQVRTVEMEGILSGELVDLTAIF
ncbi:hypothetical protein MW887_003313, partial [Aspergillus wentii]